MSPLPPDNDTVFNQFLEKLGRTGLTLYPAQENAILALFEEQNVILNTPTGSGKSLVASALHFKALAQGRLSIYTCPIKALVNEKWLALCREFGPENVGLSTGDATINRDAPILCCTAEILANLALRHGSDTPFADVVMDEFHYYADAERGTAWQVPLLTMSRSRMLLMSATLGDTTFFENELTRLTDRPTVTIRSTTRPVPLEFSYSEVPLARAVEDLLADGKGPIYVVHFTQREAAESAQDFTSLKVATTEEKAAIARELEGFKFSSPYGPEIKKLLRHGIGIHHAGLLPKYRVLTEKLAQKGLLKLLCGTDTLGVGINVPIRTVLFTQLFKFNGEKTAILSARDFHQIAGRAGRKGFDSTGWVVAQAPAHAIENLLLEQKQAAGGKKFVRRKPPENRFINWDRQTFARLIDAAPERLSSQFKVSHGMLLNVLSRPGNGCAAMRALIEASHEGPKQKDAHRRRAWQLFRALLDRRIIEFIPRTAEGAYLRLNLDLQDAFSMDQTLSLYLVDTLAQIDPQDPRYPFVLLTLVESIIEDPDLILRRQLDRVKTEAIADMKADGLDYDTRMAELEKLEYPKPEREFIYSTFNAFADAHPWVGRENIRPKSIAREMFEGFMSFSDYIKSYDLQRAEGLLLRHLASVHKVLAHTVPDSAKTDPVREMELYLRTLIRHVDSSLLDEWEKLRNPAYRPAEHAGASSAEPLPPGAAEAAADITRDPARFTAAIRQTAFRFLRALANRDYVHALETLLPPETAGDRKEADSEAQRIQDDQPAWTADQLKTVFEDYLAARSRLRLDPEARNARHTHIRRAPEEDAWIVEQMLVDPEEANDWMIRFHVGLSASRAAGDPILQLRHLGPLDLFAAGAAPSPEA